MRVPGHKFCTREFSCRGQRSMHLILCGPHTQPYYLMQQAGFFAQIGSENVVTNLDEALQRARELLQ